jgi:TRAP-type C4-dicarboxylate transport system permease small subunit
MRALLKRLYHVAGLLAALSIFAIFLLMMAQSLFRVAGVQVRGADDITAWLCAASAFLGLAATFTNGEHVRVGLWTDTLKPARKRSLELVVLIIGIAFVAWMLWAGVRYIWGSYQMNEMAQGLLVIPMWIPQLTFLFGVLIFLVSMVEQFLVVLAGGKPSYQIAQEERAARGEFTEGGV